MKKISTLLLVAVLSLGFVSCKQGNSSQNTNGYSVSTAGTARITSSNGLTLRAQPARSATKIAAIPFNEEVVILDANGPEDTIDSIKDKWIRVNYLNQEGWIFGGFTEKKLSAVTSAPVQATTQQVSDNSAADKNTATPPANLPPEIINFIQKGHNLPIGGSMSPDEIKKALGAPRNIQEEDYTSGGQGTKYYTISYPGMEISIQFDQYNGQQVYTLKKVVITRGQLKYKNSNLGLSAASLESLYSIPARKVKITNNGAVSWRYDYRLDSVVTPAVGLFQEVDAYIVGDKVSKLEWMSE